MANLTSEQKQEIHNLKVQMYEQKLVELEVEIFDTLISIQRVTQNLLEEDVTRMDTGRFESLSRKYVEKRIEYYTISEMLKDLR